MTTPNDPTPTTGDPESDAIWAALNDDDAKKAAHLNALADKLGIPNYHRTTAAFVRAKRESEAVLGVAPHQHDEHMMARVSVGMRKVAPWCCAAADLQWALIQARGVRPDATRAELERIVGAVLDLLFHPDAPDPRAK